MSDIALKVVQLLFFFSLANVFTLFNYPYLTTLIYVALIGRWRLKEGGVYFKVRAVIHMKPQKFVIVLWQIAVNNSHYDI